MSKRIRSVLCIVILFLAYTAVVVSGNRDSHFTEANRLLQAGKTAQAKRAMQAAMVESSDKYKAVMTAAGFYMIHKKDAEAEQLLARMLDDQKKLVGRKLYKYEEIAVLLELSNMRYEHGRVEEGIESVERAFNLMPDHCELQNSLAYFYAEAGTNLKRALGLAERAHNSAPDKGHITDTLGWVHYKIGDLKQAKRFLQLAVKQSPESAEQRYHLGVVYRGLGERSRAWIELNKALTADPTMSKARKDLEFLTTST